MAYVIPAIEGWMSGDCMTWLHDQAQSMTSIVEIGSWKGLSTHALLSGCPGPVFAVDHWKGNPDELNGAHKEALTGDIFAQFWQNVGGFKNLVAMRMDSSAASTYFADRSVDMVFIDGYHAKDAVVADIRAWGPKCRRLLCGHDASYESVRAAIAECGYPYNEVSNIGIWRIDL